MVYIHLRLNGLQSVPYAVRLNMLGLTTLELRRMRFDLLLCFKILHGLTDIVSNSLFLREENSY